MAIRKYDCFMMHVHIASNPKLRMLTPSERWAHVAGVLPLAAMSPIRGALLIGDRRVTAEDVAHQARVRLDVAERTLRKLRETKIIRLETFSDELETFSDELETFSDELETEVVHDWEEWNPSPISNAERQKRYRARKKAEQSNGEGPPSKDANVTKRYNGVTGKLKEVKRREVKDLTDSSVKTDMQRVFEVWKQAAQKTGRTQLSAKRQRFIRAALKDYPVEDVLDTVQGWQHSPHHRGENSQGVVYNDIEFLLRDAKNIEKFRDLNRKRNGQLSPAERSERFNAAVKRANNG